MACFLLRSPQGERWMPEGVPYRLLPGEYIVEMIIKWDCGTIEDADIAYNLEKVWTKEGLMVGNLVKKVTQTLHIKHCLKCTGRQINLNATGLEIQKKVKDTVKGFLK